jgi:prophage regulatory protein
MKLLRISEVVKKTDLSRATIYRLIQRGIFPAPVKPTPEISRWIEPELDEYVSKLAENRDHLALSPRKGSGAKPHRGIAAPVTSIHGQQDRHSTPKQFPRKLRSPHESPE